MPTVVFAHGKESGPQGLKIRRLSAVAAEYGCHVVRVDFTSTRNPDRRAALLAKSLEKAERPLILVGSSMGGYVVTIASKAVRPLALLLLAPAFYLPGYARQNPQPCAEHTVVIHGIDDQVVPLANVLRFCRRHGLEPLLLEDGHRLLHSLPQIEQLLRRMLVSLAPKRHK